jgi:thiol-disulfide isomerase/thioredoxin
MKRSLIELSFRISIVTTSVFTFALYAGNVVHCFNKNRLLLDGRTVDENSGGSFLPSILVVQAAGAADSMPKLTFEGVMPELKGGAWVNSAPLSTKSLRGKVVLINFWTYTCINSLRTLPYVKEWAAKYRDSGLVVVGVHTPEFSFEREQPNVEIALREHNVTYPVLMDNNYEIWHAFGNEYWPAFYLVDAKGEIRYHHFGEGDYREMERAIQELLMENGSSDVESPVNEIVGRGIEAPPGSDGRSPESYIGFRLAERFASPGGLKENREENYGAPAGLLLNHWGLTGPWNVNTESAVLISAPGKIVYRFHSRDLHLVLAPSKDGRPIRFRVTIDGAAPGNDCGADSSSDGTGIVREPRLYQLIRQKGAVGDRTFEIEFLDPGVQALDFTFG